MSQAEQLSQTRIRLAIETTLGSGVADSAWIAPPCTAAVADRGFKSLVERRDVWRQLADREIVSEAWQIRTSHEVGLDFLRWVLLPQMTHVAGGRYALDPENVGPSYCFEMTSELGDISRFAGCQISEIQIVLQDRRIVTLELTWVALHRAPIEEPLAGDTGELFETALMPTRGCSFAATTGAWGADPRIDNAAIMHGGQIFLTRKIEAANFGPDGRPDTITRAPWVVMAEVYCPPHPGLTDIAFADEWNGRFAVWLGSLSHHLRINRAIGFVASEDFQAYDWRVFRIAMEAETDNLHGLLEWREDLILLNDDGSWLLNDDGTPLLNDDGNPPPMLNDDGQRLRDDDGSQLYNDL